MILEAKAETVSNTSIKDCVEYDAIELAVLGSYTKDAQHVGRYFLNWMRLVNKS